MRSWETCVLLAGGVWVVRLLWVYVSLGWCSVLAFGYSLRSSHLSLFFVCTHYPLTTYPLYKMIVRFYHDGGMKPKWSDKKSPLCINMNHDYGQQKGPFVER